MSHDSLKVHFKPPDRCPKCGCAKVYMNQISIDERCAECVRLDRFEEIVEKLLAALQK